MYALERVLPLTKLKFIHVKTMPIATREGLEKERVRVTLCSSWLCAYGYSRTELWRGIYRDEEGDMLPKERASNEEIMGSVLGFYRGSGEGQTELRRGC